MGTPDTSLPSDKTTANPLLRHSTWVLLALVVVAALLRLPLLDRSIWFDEACMSDQRIGTTSQLLSTLYTDIHPPLFVLFMHYWNGVFGDGEVAMRVPAMISGLLCIPLTYWTGYRLLGKGPALFAAALLTLSPVHVWYCTEARLYAPMITTTLFAFGCVDRLTDPLRPRQRALFALHMLNVAVMLSLHYYLAVVVVALAGVAPLLTRGITRAASTLMIWHGIGILLLASFVFAKMQLGEFETSQGYLRALTVEELFRFLFEWGWSGRTMPSSEYGIVRGLGVGFVWLGVGLTMLGLVHVFGNLMRKPRALLVPMGMLLLPCFMFALVILGYENTYIERSLIPALPFIFLLAAAGLHVLPSKARLVAGGLGMVLAALALVTLYGTFATEFTLYKPHPDWRSAARYLGQELDSGNAGTPVFTSMPNPRSLSYYDARIQDAKNLEVELAPREIGRKVTKRLGAWLGEIAESNFEDFAAHNRRLLAEAQLVVRRSKPTPAELDWPAARTDGTCYLIRNEWHPHVTVDGSVEALLAHPQTTVLHTERCSGVTIYKVRLQR